MKLEQLIKKKRDQKQAASSRIHAKHEQLVHDIRQNLYRHREVLQFDENERYTQFRKLATNYLNEYSLGKYSDLMLQHSERQDILDSLMQAILGYGQIESFLKDDMITEIMVNGMESIFIEKQGKLSKVLDANDKPIAFKSEDELMHIIDKIVAPINRKVDQSNPIVDARLKDGSRVSIVLPPVALNGITLTIRKFPKQPLLMADLIHFGTLTAALAQQLKELVAKRSNMIISGGTGTGKTTFLNALSAHISPEQRIVTVEDSAELQIQQIDNLVRLEARPANVEGKGEITIRDLVRSALRMRPDSIIVGEVRGGEALDMLQAMNTGHDGSLTTAHANSAEDLLFRLETMALMAGVELPLKAIRQQIVSAVDYIIHLSKTSTGQRLVKEVVKLDGLNGEDYRYQTVYKN